MQNRTATRIGLTLAAAAIALAGSAGIATAESVSARPDTAQVTWSAHSGGGNSWDGGNSVATVFPA